MNTRRSRASRASRSSAEHALAPNAFNAESLRRLLITTRITTARSFIRDGGSEEEYRAAAAMYFERYVERGDLSDLAKAILKMVSLRSLTAQ